MFELKLCDANVPPKHGNMNSRNCFDRTPGGGRRMDSSDEDLVLIMLSNIKKRRFWTHSLLQSRGEEKLAPQKAEQELLGGDRVTRSNVTQPL